MHRSTLLLLFCLSFIVATGLAGFLPVAYLSHRLIYFAILIVAVCATVIFYIFKKYPPPRCSLPASPCRSFSEGRTGDCDVLKFETQNLASLPDANPKKISMPRRSLPDLKVGGLRRFDGGTETPPRRECRDGEAEINFWFVAGLIICGLLFGLWRFSLTQKIFTPGDIAFYDQQKITWQGVVAAEPQTSGDKLKLIVAARQLANGRPVVGKVLVSTNLYPNYQYGDLLTISGKLQQPQPIEDFAYDKYLARYNIYAVSYAPKIVFVKIDQGQPILAALLKFKAKLLQTIAQGMPEPASSLGGPIIFGGSQGLGADIVNNFSRLGLTHIIAVSGFNVSLLAAIILYTALALGLSRKQSFWLSLVALITYVIMTGLTASAVRAGLMSALLLLAIAVGRLNKITNSLVLVATLMLLQNPLLLQNDVGFQLSFLALLGIVYLEPIFSAMLEQTKVGAKILNFTVGKVLWESLAVTVAAQVFTLPILVYNFGQLSLLASLANLAILWTLSVLTIALLAALPLAMLWPALAMIFFWPSFIILQYILWLTATMGSWPWACAQVSDLWSGWVWIYYAGVILAVAKLRKYAIIKL